MRVQLALYNITETILLADWSDRCISCTIRSGEHGYESCEAELSIAFLEAFLYYQQVGPLVLAVNWGDQALWKGRLEDPTQFAKTTTGLKITAIGYWVALSDVPYTALWSTASYDAFVPVTENDLASRSPSMYSFDTQNRLLLSTVKGATYGNNTNAGELVFKFPYASGRQIVGIAFDYLGFLPTNWLFQYQRHSEGFGVNAGVTIVTGAGAAFQGSVNAVITACDYVGFIIFNNTGVNSTPAGETTTNAVRITNLRIVTTTANRINTVFTVNRAAGVNVTATVGSTARMYVGQLLQIGNNAGATTSETVTVLSIGSATQFNATFAFAHVINDTVQAHIVYPDEIMKDVVTATNTVNTTQISASTAQIQSQAIDIVEATYEDRYPNDIINDLLKRGDNQTPPRTWVAQVYDDKTLRVNPRGSGRAWYTDVTSLEVVRTLTQLFNSVYVAYKNTANDRTLRTTINANAASVTKFGITRRKAIQSNTVNAIQANTQRDAVLALQQDPVPRANITIDRVYDQYGVQYPLFYVRADDTLTIRNLPPILSAAYDKIRTLVIVRTEYNTINDTLTLELEVSLPNIEVQLASVLKA